MKSKQGLLALRRSGCAGLQMALQQSHRAGKKIEMRFAYMKRTPRLDRLRLRGLNGARGEVLLAATAQNLRRLARAVRNPVRRGHGM
jgi:hypothetical protein